jgi:hypothetical protein
VRQITIKTKQPCCWFGDYFSLRTTLMRAAFLHGDNNKKGEITIANISINPSNLPCKHSAGDFSFHL